MSRTGRLMNHEYPAVVEALESEPSEEFIADGEIVAFENGITSFSRLQRRGRERVPVFLYLFDLPEYEGEDLRRGRCASARRASGGRSSSAARCASTRTATARTARSSTARRARRASRA